MVSTQRADCLTFQQIKHIRAVVERKQVVGMDQNKSMEEIKGGGMSVKPILELFTNTKEFSKKEIED